MLTFVLASLTLGGPLPSPIVEVFAVEGVRARQLVLLHAFAAAPTLVIVAVVFTVVVEIVGV